MRLIDLIQVMEGDTKVHIEVNHREVYEGQVGDIDLDVETLERNVKSVWLSTMRNAIWIDI